MTDDQTIHEPRLWKDNGWTARVLKNEDDDGWAVAMIKDGEPEPALVGPWTMGRDKRNPKPLDKSAFLTLVKTASEFVRRHEQHLQASLHQSFTVSAESPSSNARVTVTLDINPDEFEPFATLSAVDDAGEQLASKRVEAGFKLTRGTAQQWVASGFK